MQINMVVVVYMYVPCFDNNSKEVITGMQNVTITKYEMIVVLLSPF